MVAGTGSLHRTHGGAGISGAVTASWMSFRTESRWVGNEGVSHPPRLNCYLSLHELACDGSVNLIGVRQSSGGGAAYPMFCHLTNDPASFRAGRAPGP